MLGDENVTIHTYIVFIINYLIYYTFILTFNNTYNFIWVCKLSNQVDVVNVVRFFHWLQLPQSLPFSDKHLYFVMFRPTMSYSISTSVYLLQMFILVQLYD